MAADPLSVAVLIPVLDRPHRVTPLLESLALTVTDAHVDPVFVCSPDDHEQKAAVRAAGLTPLVVDWQPGRGDYARKMNLGFQETTTDFVFLAADDLRFNEDWLDQALETQHATRACVVGTNDLGNQRTVKGTHSTHTLVSRRYGECGTIDNDGVLLDEGYWHVFVDDEFVQTAAFRETYAHSAVSRVEHLHPDWSKGQEDATYAKGREFFIEDQRRYMIRRRMWAPR